MYPKLICLLLFFQLAAIPGLSQPVYFHWGYPVVTGNAYLASNTYAPSVFVDENQNAKMLFTDDVSSRIVTYSPTHEIVEEIHLPVPCRRMSVNAQGEFVVMGVFQDTVDFDGSAATYELIAAQYEDNFIATYDASGNLIWARQFWTDADFAYYLSFIHLETDDQGNIFLAGNFRDSTDFDPGAGVEMVAAQGDVDMFLLKLNSAGDLLWINQYGTPAIAPDWGLDWIEQERMLSMRLDDNGNVLIAGSLQESIDFNPGGTTPVMSDGGRFYIARVNSNGELIWVKTLNFFNSLHLFQVCAIADNENNVIVTFDTGSQSLDIDPGPATLSMPAVCEGGSCYLLKLNPDGNFMWAKQYGETYISHGCLLETDADNNIYWVGGYRGIISFGSDSLTWTSDLSANPAYYHEQDVFFSRFDPDGNLGWVHRIKGLGNERINSFKLDDDANIYAVGSFVWDVHFAPDQSNDSIISQGIQPWHANAFVMKFGSANEAYAEHMAWLYPNPNDGNFYLELYEACDLRIFDLSGNVVYTQDGIVPSWAAFDLSFLSSGIYFIHLQNSTHEEVLKMIIYE